MKLKLLAIYFLVVLISKENVDGNYQQNQVLLKKKLKIHPIKNVSCFKLSLDKFPKDLFSEKELKRGAIAIHWVVAVYIFSILSLLIQAYITGAIKTMADNFRVASESARNTMVIWGQLFPEFFVSFISIFVHKGNIGAGTVIGSCAANSLLTLGVVGLMLTSGPVKLSWYPLWRDNIFYLFTVTILLWTTYDHELKWQECLFLVSVYFLYLLIINFNHKIERGVRRLVIMYRTGDDEQEADQEIEKTPMTGKCNSPMTERKKLFERRSSKVLVDQTIPEENSDDISCDHTDLNIDGIDAHDEDTITLQNEDLDDFDGREDRISLCTEDGYLSAGYGYASDGGYLSEKGYLSERGYHSERGYGSINQAYLSDTKEGYNSEGDYLGSNPPIGNYSDRHVSRFAQHAQRVTHRMKKKLVQGSFYVTLDMDHYVDGPYSPFVIPDKWFFKILWAFSIPAVCIFYLTIPDCRKPKWRKYYPLTLIMSTFWVAVLTYVLVWIAAQIGYIWKVPDAVMGFGFLATGLSISDIVATYLATKAGFGTKAVYSIYGSNVFNIAISLGLVWFIGAVLSDPYELNSGSIVYVNLCQLIIVLTPLLLQFTRWRLNRALALVYLFLYCCFTTIVVLLEYDIIGDFNPPVCSE